MRLLRWIAGLALVAGLVRLVARRRRRETWPSDRTQWEPWAQEPPQAESPTSWAPPPSEDSTAPSSDDMSESLEDRRARIHERATEAIEAMNEPPPGA